MVRILVWYGSFNGRKPEHSWGNPHCRTDDPYPFAYSASNRTHDAMGDTHRDRWVRLPRRHVQWSAHRISFPVRICTFQFLIFEMKLHVSHFNNYTRFSVGECLNPYLLRAHDCSLQQVTYFWMLHWVLWTLFTHHHSTKGYIGLTDALPVKVMISHIRFLLHRVQNRKWINDAISGMRTSLPCLHWTNVLSWRDPTLK